MGGYGLGLDAAANATWLWQSDNQFRITHGMGLTAAAENISDLFQGRSLVDLPAYFISHQDKLAAKIDKQEPFFDHEIEVALGPECRVWASFTGTPFFDTDATFLGYKGIGRETTNVRRKPIGQGTEQSSRAKALEREAIERDLRIALTRNEFVLYYQPIVDSRAVTTGYEALVRWEHPTEGLLSPARFIDVAETSESSLIIEIGQVVLEKACTKLAMLSKNERSAGLTMAVNLSARQLTPDLVDVIKQIICSTGAPADKLKLEITESSLLSNVNQTIGLMHDLNAIGIRFSLDDFGTGYSSLSYLKRLPLSLLKIDQSFVRELLTDPLNGTLVNTILTLAKNLGMGVIAEGVEQPAQHAVLRDMGCREFQGYLFGKPMPLAD
jgi:EAL domain-containing protein (putative c-di-GMP-specific phosphodiesterase class I)